MDQDPVALILETANSLVSGFFARLPQIGIALLVVMIALVTASVLRAVLGSILSRTGTRAALISLVKNLISIGAWVIGVAIAITIIFPSVTPASLIAGLGLTSLAVGFAFKDVFENFLAGVIILAREKMRIGDVIECEDVFGRIEDILIRETHVREMDGELVIVPNAFLFKNPLTIQTDAPLKRNELVIGVDYAADLKQVREVLGRALKGCESVDGSKESEIVCTEFAGSSINFTLLWWSGSEPKSQRQSFDEVAFAVKSGLDEAGITIPFPQQTLSFREEAQPIAVRGLRGNGADDQARSA